MTLGSLGCCCVEDDKDPDDTLPCGGGPSVVSYQSFYQYDQFLDNPCFIGCSATRTETAMMAGGSSYVVVAGTGIGNRTQGGEGCAALDIDYTFSQGGASCSTVYYCGGGNPNTATPGWNINNRPVPGNFWRNPFAESPIGSYSNGGFGSSPGQGGTDNTCCDCPQRCSNGQASLS